MYLTSILEFCRQSGNFNVPVQQKTLIHGNSGYKNPPHSLPSCSQKATTLLRAGNSE